MSDHHRLCSALVLDGGAPPVCAAFATLGAGGKHMQNVERDAHTWLNNFHNGRLGLWKLPMVLESPRTVEVVDDSVELLPMSCMLRSIWNAGPHQRIVSLLGPRGPRGAAEFWEHAKLTPWGRNHPCLQGDHDIAKLLPIVLHLDGVEVYTNHEFYVFSYSCPLTSNSGHDIWEIKFPLVYLSVARMKTKAVKKQVFKRVANYLEYEFRNLMKGVAGEKAFDNTEFDKGTILAENAGKTADVTNTAK